MELNEFFRGLIENDDTRIIICDLNHTIVYMNKAAREFYNGKGLSLIGKNLLDCHGENSREKIKQVVAWFLKNEKNNFVHTFYNEKENKDGYMIALRAGNGKLIGYYEKHEYRNRDLSSFYDLK